MADDVLGNVIASVATVSAAGESATAACNSAVCHSPGLDVQMG